MSAGIVVNPTFAPTLRLSVDYTRIAKTDNVTAVNLNQNNINLEDQIAGLITRGPVEGKSCTPVCPITGFDGAYRNAVRALTRSYDLSVDYAQPAGWLGTFSIAATGTRLMQAGIQTAPALPLSERVRTVGVPRWQALTTMSWEKGALSASWTTQYLDSYWASLVARITLRWVLRACLRRPITT